MRVGPDALRSRAHRRLAAGRGRGLQAAGVDRGHPARGGRGHGRSPDRRRQRAGRVPLAGRQPARTVGAAGVGRARLAPRRGARADTALAMLLEGKRLLVTGVLTRGSIAYTVAERAQQEGAEVVLTGFGRTRRMTERAAARLPSPPEVLELDVNSPSDLDALASSLGHVDGALHAIASAPGEALGGNFMSAPAESAELAFRTSAYSFKALAGALAPLMGDKGGSFVGMDFDASVAWPVY